jgi:hypothetical protein
MIEKTGKELLSSSLAGGVVGGRPALKPGMNGHPMSVRCGEGLPSVGGRT